MQTTLQGATKEKLHFFKLHLCVCVKHVASKLKSIRYKREIILRFNLPYANNISRAGSRGGIFAVSTDFIRITVILVIKHYKPINNRTCLGQARLGNARRA